jgi:hypothetical protein
MAKDKGKTVKITFSHYYYISELRISVNFLYIFDVAYMHVLKLFFLFALV